jgi:SH3 domain protein
VRPNRHDRRSNLKENKMLQLTRLLMLMTLSWPLFAEGDVVRFVTDEHAVDLKSGFSDQDHVLAPLEPGESVTILQVNEEGGQTRIQRENGDIGWIRADDLTDTPKAKTLPATVTTETPAVKTPDQLQQELGRLQNELIQSRAASADILRIQAERDQLQSNVITLKREAEALRQEKSALNEDQKQTWIVMGGIVVFGGILLGLILPRISTRRRNPWGSL